MKTESIAEKITREAGIITRALRRNNYIVRKRNGYGAWNIFKGSQHCFLLSWRNNKWELHPQNEQTDDYNTIRNLIDQVLQVSKDQQSLL